MTSIYEQLLDKFIENLKYISFYYTTEISVEHPITLYTLL